MTRTATGLRAEPRIGIDALRLSFETSMFIGSPAHGIAWWEELAVAPAAPRQLGLAALATPVDDELRAFLEMATVVVPHHDEDRFIDAFLPKLCRKIAVASSDRSVEIPERRPNTLVLTIHAGNGHRVGLTWERDVEGGEWRETLWGASSRGKNRAVEDAIIEAVTAVVRSVPQMLERHAFGERLAPEARLEGMAAVRFITDLLPAIEAIEGVTIERIGTLADYREAAGAPVVSLGGSGSAANDWFDLTITVSVGGETVPFADLFVALAEGQSHLILPSGTYFSLEHDELRELAKLIAEARGTARRTR